MHVRRLARPGRRLAGIVLTVDGRRVVALSLPLPPPATAEQPPRTVPARGGCADRSINDRTGSGTTR